MENNKKCWYSIEGLKILNRKQREGVIIKESNNSYHVIWTGNKTPNVLAKIFISTDPLSVLVKGSDEDDMLPGKPITINEHAWFYIEEKKIILCEEVKDENGEWKETTSREVSWLDVAKKMSPEDLYLLIK